MGRNLYILAGTLVLLAILSGILSVTNIAQQPGSAGDNAIWRLTGIVLFCLGCVAALAGILSTLFEQTERRMEADRRQTRRNRRS